MFGRTAEGGAACVSHPAVIVLVVVVVLSAVSRGGLASLLPAGHGTWSCSGIADTVVKSHLRTDRIWSCRSTDRQFWFRRWNDVLPGLHVAQLKDAFSEDVERFSSEMTIL